MSDTNRRDNPTKVELLDSFNIVAASCGKNHTLFLTGQTLSFSLSYTELQPAHTLFLTGHTLSFNLSVLHTLSSSCNWNVVLAAGRCPLEEHSEHWVCSSALQGGSRDTLYEKTTKPKRTLMQAV